MIVKMLPEEQVHKRLLKVVKSSNYDGNKLEEILILQGTVINKSIFKRSLDILISSLVLIFLLSWLFPIIAILIKISSKGDILFLQNREGANKSIFKCIKFRTMKSDSKDVDERGQYMQASPQDSRVYSFGSFLRRTSLDELPQFINVLKGEMSIVGPRPHPIPLNRESEKNIVGYNLRHLVKPGITGLAQVNGFRGETKEIGLMKKRVENDIAYVKNWNISLDFKIIFQTGKNIILGEDHVY